MRYRLVALAVVAVVIATWPIVLHLGDAVPGEKFSSAYNVYRNALLHAPWTWFDVPFENANFPDGGRGVLVAIPQFLLAGALAPITGETAAINLSLLAHLVAGVCAAGVLARRVAPEAGLIGAMYSGVAIGLGSFAVGVWATGQPENVGVVYVLLAVERGLVWLRGGPLHAAFTCLLAVVLAFLSSPCLVEGPLLAAPIAFLLAWRHMGAPRVFTLGVAVLAVTALAAAPYRRTLEAREEGQVLCPAVLSMDVPAHSSFDLATADWSALVTPPPLADPNVADPVALLLPVDLSGLKKEISFVYLGGTVLLLAAWGLFRAPRRVGWLLACAALPLLLALGPRLRLNGWVILDHGWNLWMPLYWLRRVPALGAILETVQTPGRLVLGGMIPLGMAAVIGVERLPVWGRRGALILVIAETFLVAPPRPPAWLLDVTPADAYRWLAEQPDQDAVVDAPPLGFTAGPPVRPPITWTRSLFGRSVFHHHPVPYTGCFPPLFNERILHSDLAHALEQVVAGDEGVSLESSGRGLRELGVGWIVWHPHADVATAEEQARVDLALAAAFELAYTGGDGTRVYRLPAAP